MSEFDPSKRIATVISPLATGLRTEGGQKVQENSAVTSPTPLVS